MTCPKCDSEDYVKSGFMKGKQRYKCKKCKCNFTQSHKRGANLKTKLQALQLYLEGMGFRAIGRIIGVNNVTVLNWIRSMGDSVKSYVQTEMPTDIRHVDFIEMDEMWHFTVKKNENYGSGSLLIGIPKKSLASQLAVAERKRLKI
tara:strand:- start:277 stop:714 length:438 start_codon:yes stop_codon:yes gene_type:complete